MALFTACMLESHYVPSTIYTYVSALGYSLELMGFSNILLKYFYVFQVLNGYRKLGFRYVKFTLHFQFWKS